MLTALNRRMVTSQYRLEKGLGMFMFHIKTVFALYLSIVLINCCKSGKDLTGGIANKSDWAKENVDDAIALCVAVNSSMVEVNSYCSCLVSAITSRWYYQDYSKNKSNYDATITSDGTADKCKSSIGNIPFTATPAGQGIEIIVNGLIGATKPIISPDINGIPASYDVADKKIFFSWVAGSDPKLGIRDYTVHRYELPKCAGLSIDTATLRGTSLPFEGEEGKTYSFKVSTYNNLGISKTSECSNDLTIDSIPPKNSSISINSGEMAAANTAVTLTLIATEANQMYITNEVGCQSGGTWEEFSTKKSWELGQTNTTATVYAKFKDVAGNESSCVGDTIIHDTIPPSGTFLTINNGSRYINTTSVTLTLAAKDAFQMYVTNTPGCGSEGSWEPYTITRSWILGQTNSQTTVYVKFKDALGNEGACINDTIIHDNIVPTETSIVINDGAKYTTQTSVSLTIAAKDADQMYITNTPGCSANGLWEEYATTKLWNLAETNTNTTVYAKFKDAAENEGSCINAAIVHDDSPPTDLSILINGGATYTTSPSISLSLTATDAAEMYITEKFDCSSEGSWEKYTKTRDWILQDFTGIAKIYAKFKDSLGNESSCIGSYSFVNSLHRISGGRSNTCAITKDDTIKCWGILALGSGPNDNTATPRSVTGISNAIAVAVAESHACAVLRDGGVRCWGGNGSGQLGNGSTVDSITSVQVLGISDAIDISVADFGHSCALLKNGNIKCWGTNGWGCLGDGTSTYRTTPVQVQGISNAIGVTTGDYYYSCAILNDGTLKCWGKIGGDGSSLESSIPYQMPGYSNVVAVESGSGFCALIDKGTMKCWGNEYIGEGFSNISNAIALRVSAFHACLVLKTGEAKCWGLNGHGKLGDGSTDSRKTPVAVTGISSASSIGLGLDHSCTMLQDGSVKCWGINDYGQLGNGTVTGSTIPVPVANFP